MQFTEDQEIGKHFVNQGKNISIMGAGGVGKSFLMSHLIDDETLVCAPTGIAALNIGGVTASSLFSLPIGVCLDNDKYSPAHKARDIFNSGSIKRLIIDEAYMFRLDMFELIDQKLRVITRKDEPFGGIQVILVGDPFQISPVLTYKESEEYNKRYDSIWMFKSMAWKMGGFQPVILREVMRQEDKRQQRILESIRVGDKWVGKAVDRINEISSPTPIDGSWLCAFNKQAETINNIRFNQLKGEPKTYTSTGFGFNNNEFPVPSRLELKVGAKVIVKANDINGNYVNGTQGIVTYLEDDSIGVEREDGRKVTIEKYKWEKYDYVVGLHGVERVVIGRFTQIPVKLGYAISIHGSQGCTLSKGNLDFGRGAFSAGQAYVGLSRFKDLNQIHVQNGLDYSDVIVDSQVKEFYKEMEAEYAGSGY